MIESIGLNIVADAVLGGEEYVVSSYVLLPVGKYEYIYIRNHIKKSLQEKII